MKTVLKLEELGMFLLALYLFNQLHFAWWVFLVLLLTPDISFLGYVGGDRIGAVIYNLFHHRGLAVLIYLTGIYFRSETTSLIGVILFAHSSMDRIFGYGLKYFEGFKFTHLGKVGKQS